MSLQGNRGGGGNQGNKVGRPREPRQSLESELEKPSSIFAILRPAVEMEGSPAYRDRPQMTFPHQLPGKAPVCEAGLVIPHTRTIRRIANVYSAQSSGSQVH